MSESPPTILLDVSRTVARARLPQPTGIDRVERAYIRWASAHGACFLAGFDGQQYLFDADVVAALLGWIDDGDPRPQRDLQGFLQIQRDRKLRAAQSLIRREARAHASPSDLTGMLQVHLPAGGHFFNVGHDNLDAVLLDHVAAAGFTRSVLIHDTIPLDQPEFARAGTVSKFRAKLDAIRGVDLVVANSADTATRLRHHGHTRAMTTALLGIEKVESQKRRPATAVANDGKDAAAPTFIALGTIEPRKNHALLLRIWQRFWDEMGEGSPKLIIYGRRGWENREVFKQLDTLPMMGRTVVEAGSPDDAELQTAMANATALLFPSFAEGYGLPLGEALAAGTPVLASNLDALREVGADVPEYIDPTDEVKWVEIIQRYAAVGSPERMRQVQRIKHWSAPNWHAHFLIIENAMETILVQASKDR